MEALHVMVPGVSMGDIGKLDPAVAVHFGTL